MSFAPFGETLGNVAEEIAIVDTEVVANGAFVKLVNGRVQKAVSGEAFNFYGLAVTGGTGNSGGTVKALVFPIRSTGDLFRATWATAAVRGDSLDIDAGADDPTTDSDHDLIVESQASGMILCRVDPRRLLICAPLNTYNAATFAAARKGTDYFFSATAPGADATSADQNVTVTSKHASYTPAAGDIIQRAEKYVTATGAWAGLLTVGTDIAATLVTSSGVKATIKQAAGDLSLNTIVLEIRDVA